VAVGDGVRVDVALGVYVLLGWVAEATPGKFVSMGVDVTVLVDGVRNWYEKGVWISGRTGSTRPTVGYAAYVASGSMIESMLAFTFHCGTICNANSPARQIRRNPISRMIRISLHSRRSRSGIFMTQSSP
jgi:hypothetical protein